MNAGRVLASRLRLARHSLFAPEAGARSPLVVAALLVAMAGMAVTGFHSHFRSLAVAGAHPAEITAALGLILDAALVSLVVLGLDATVATLVLDPDLELLRRAPVRPVALLALKLLDAFPRTATPLLVLALPAIAAFGMTSRSGPALLMVAPVALAALWLAAMGLGVAFALPLLRIVPARRAREALGLIAALVLTAVWLANALLLPRLAEQGGAPLEGFRAVLGAVPTFTPGRAAAEWLAAPLGATRAVASLGGLTLGAALLAGLAGARLLGRVLESVAAPPVRPAVARPRPAARGDRPRPWLGVILGRDARLFFRDWTVLADVGTAALLWTLLPFLSRAVFEPGGTALATGMLVSLAIGLGYEVAARAVPFERRAATWMQLAPVPPDRWVRGKLAGSVAVAGPILLGAWVVLVAVLGLGAAAALQTLAAGLGALALALGIGLWAGTRFGDPRWINPRAMLTLGGRLVSAGLMIVQISLWITAVALLERAAAGPVRGLATLAVAGAVASIAVLPIRSATRRIGRLGWYG